MEKFSSDKYLKTFLNWESKLHQAGAGSFALDRIEKLLTVFGRPDDKLRFAHIAGTKGKGSSAAFLASILRASGYRVGLYTSPHLHSLCERIRILEPDVKVESLGDGKGGPRDEVLARLEPPSCRRQVEGGEAGRGGEWQEPLPFEGSIPWEEVEQRLRYYHDDIEKLRVSGVEITFYELMTVLAVSYFASKEVQIVVLETGLGGRLDATNVFETSVCGITPIGFDHMNVLGATLTDIAREKAGIIRSPSQRVALAPQPAEAMTVLQARCQEFGTRPTVVGDDLPYKVHAVTADGVTFDAEGRRKYTDIFSPLTGLHQVQNAVLAIAMAEDLETYGFLLTEEAVRQGIASVQWPARFERISDKPVVILDCAHTGESAAVFAATFQAAYPGKKAVVVLGMSSDKDHQAVIKALLPMTGTFVFTKANTSREPAQPRELCKLLAHIVAQPPGLGRSTESIPEALAQARGMAGKDGIICVTGSVFVCAEARSALSRS